MITSSSNAKIKWLRSLQTSSRERRQEGAFVVEGVRLAEEALRAGWPVRLVLFSDDLSERGRTVVDAFAARDAPVEQALPGVLRLAADTQTPQGIVIALEQRALPLSVAPDFVFIPDGIGDPGNLGTMLRTAVAAGVQAVFCPPETADAFAPKVLRAGMGAHFRLPIHSLSWDDIAVALGGLPVFVADARDGRACFELDLRAPLALVVGGEAEGARQDARRLAQGYVRIPMPGGGESLNAAIAAGILFYEVARQRNWE